MVLSRRARSLFAGLAVVLGFGAGAPRVARGAVCSGGTPTACGSPTSVTYNGVAMTLAGSATNGTVRSEIWYLKAPASGAHNVVVTAPDATDVTATSMSFTGVDQTANLGTAFVSGIGTSAAPSVTTAASGLGSIVFDALGAVGSTTPTVSGNQIVRRTNSTSTGLNPVVIGSSTAAGQTTSVNMSWTIPSADWALSALPIPPSSPLTAVGIDAFTASWQADGVLLEWQGGYEPKSAGFLVYRSDGAGERVQLNADLIPGDAFAGRASSYSWSDQSAGWNGAVSYWLKDIKVDGSFTWIGPATPMALGATTQVQAPVPVQGADGGVASQWKAKGEVDDGLGGCALADHSRGRAGLQLLFVLGMIVSARRRKHRLIVAALFLAGGIATNLGMPGPVAAAGGVSIDASATATGTSVLTFSHTMGAGSNGLIVVGVVVPIICQTTSTTDSGNCGACGNTCSASIASSIDVGLLGLWHFSEGSGTTSVDSSGTGNTATMTATPGWVTGYSGTGIELNGTISASANVGTWFGSNNTLSAAGWVYVTSTTNGPIFGVIGTSWNMPFLSIAGTTVYGGLWNGSAIVSRSATVTANNWHYLALTYDPAAGGTMKFYVDGALSGMATVTYVGSGIADSWTTSIGGAKPSGVNSVLKGKIDEIRAYNRVLSAAEVSALYTARLGCTAGVCNACPMGQTSCGGVCVTTATDGSNCGGCGITCNAAGGETCISSACGCVTGTDCSTNCIVTTSDPNNCGGCAISCGAPTPAATDSGLLGHWHLSEGTGSTSADSSGTGNTAVLTGSPTWTTSGYVGNALTFNGTSNYAEAPVGTWFGSNNKLSVSAWVYATSTTNGPIFGVTQSNPPGSWNMPFLSINGATAWVGLWTGSAGNYVSATVSLNNWHHLAMTYDPTSTTRKFYVDGALSNTTTMTYGGSNAFDYWSTYIPGDKPTGVSAYFKGTLDEVRAYNRTLTAAEIQIIYYARQSCSSSTCGGCQNGETLCSGVCTDPAIDTGNCGTCGNACNTGAGETCTAGVCVCTTGTSCSGVCVDTTTNQNNCGMCGNVCGVATCSSCNMGLLGSWQLNEGTGTTSADASGNGNTVTFSATAPTWTTGHTGAMTDKALTFTAASSTYINATIGAWFGANQTLSASAWVYATSTTHGPVFGVTSSKPGGGWNMPFLSVNGANVYGWIYNNTVMTSTVTLNTWHQLTVTYDPAGSPTSRFYVDGAQVATGTGSYSSSMATDYLTTYISGAKPSGVTNSYLNGTIDDLRAYKRVLSAGEVSLLYAAQTTCASSTCGGCPAGTTNCSGTCTNLAADNNNCNACGNVCSGGTPNCILSTCQ
jgi:Concanavalin A-like lectin/glucanases superfamily